MPESSPISPDSPFRPITEALARTIDGLLGRLEDLQQDATIYIEVRGGKLCRGDVKMPIDFSDAQ